MEAHLGLQIRGADRQGELGVQAVELATSNKGLWTLRLLGTLGSKPWTRLGWGSSAPTGREQGDKLQKGRTE